jgi:hypothetical protein
MTLTILRFAFHHRRQTFISGLRATLRHGER